MLKRVIDTVTLTMAVLLVALAFLSTTMVSAATGVQNKPLSKTELKALITTQKPKATISGSLNTSMPRQRNMRSRQRNMESWRRFTGNIPRKAQSSLAACRHFSTAMRSASRSKRQPEKRANLLPSTAQWRKLQRSDHNSRAGRSWTRGSSVFWGPTLPREARSDRIDLTPVTAPSKSRQLLHQRRLTNYLPPHKPPLGAYSAS